jgi:hypothetical protein
MRTTFTLDDDIAERLKDLARRERVSFRRVVNETLRRGLSAQEPRGRRPRFRVEPFRSAFRPGVDPLRLNQLGDELEARRVEPVTRDHPRR